MILGLGNATIHSKWDSVKSLHRWTLSQKEFSKLYFNPWISTLDFFYDFFLINYFCSPEAILIREYAINSQSRH